MKAKYASHADLGRLVRALLALALMTATLSAVTHFAPLEGTPRLALAPAPQNPVSVAADRGSGDAWRDAGAGGPRDLFPTAETKVYTNVWRDAGAGGPREIFGTR
jgi:hypothetical protein